MTIERKCRTNEVVDSEDSARIIRFLVRNGSGYCADRVSEGRWVVYVHPKVQSLADAYVAMERSVTEREREENRKRFEAIKQDILTLYGVAVRSGGSGYEVDQFRLPSRKVMKAIGRAE